MWVMTHEHRHGDSTFYDVKPDGIVLTILSD